MTPLGDDRYARINLRLNAAFQRHCPLIIAHRGTSSGTVPENTSDAAHAAFLSGADIVEIDVIASRDGHHFVFHTGTEHANLGLDITLEELTADEIDQLGYRARGRGGRPRRIERLDAFLEHFRGMDRIFNIDRSWHLWPGLLDALAATGMADQILLKCPASDVEAVRALAAHDTPFPFVLVCHTWEEALAGAELPDLNLVGVELIAPDEGGRFLDEDALHELHERGLFTLANAEVLGDPEHLFAGFDDEVSVAVHPDLGWGRLFDLGIRAIQTDWPWLLHSYRRSRAESRHPDDLTV